MYTEIYIFTFLDDFEIHVMKKNYKKLTYVENIKLK